MSLRASPAQRTLSDCFGHFPGRERTTGKRKYEKIIFMTLRNDKKEVV